MEDKIVGAIIVLYNPDWDSFLDNLKTITGQVDVVCIVDNSSEENHARLNTKSVHYIPLCNNTGIAHAQNIGVKYLIENHCEYVLFCDQDSRINDGVVRSLLEDFQLIKQSGHNISGIAPQAINKATSQKYSDSSLIVGTTSIDISNRRTKLFIHKSAIMSSMSLMPLSSFISVGGFDESLFIDFVEYEWCWRASKEFGYSFYVDPEVIVEHTLGESKTILNHTISLSSPFRIYYQYRNFIWCRKLDYVPEKWLKYHKSKFTIKVMIYSLCIKPRLQYMRSIFGGVKDGIRLAHVSHIPKWNA